MSSLWDRNISITTRLVDTVTIPMLFKTVGSHKIDPKLLITHRFKLDKILDAYETFGNAAKTKALKVIIEALATMRGDTYRASARRHWKMKQAMTYQSLNPATGKLLKKFDELTDKELETKIVTAATCFETWRKKTYAERAVIVAKAAAILHAKANEFAHTMTLEMGKRISEARGEVEFSSNILAYYAKNAERFLAPVKLHPTLGEGHMESSPIGVVFCVEPWNFPLLPACPGRRSAFDGGQRCTGKTRGYRAAMRDRLREAFDRGGCPRRFVYQSSDFARSVGPRRRRPSDQRCGADGQRCGRKKHRGTSRQEP